MFMCGRFDEATPEAHWYFASLVPGSPLHIFEGGAHHPFATERDESLRVLSEFLKTIPEEVRA
jgi:proline iminopeptidase